jgi:hypothetical protein
MEGSVVLGCSRRDNPGSIDKPIRLKMTNTVMTLKADMEFRVSMTFVFWILSGSTPVLCMAKPAAPQAWNSFSGEHGR